MYGIFYSSSNDDHAAKELYVSDEERILFNFNEAFLIADSLIKKGCFVRVVEVSIDD